MSPIRSGSLSLTTVLLLAACGGGATEPGPEPEEEIEFPAITDSLNLDIGGRHGGSELLLVMDQLNTQSPRLVDIPGSPAGAATFGPLLALVDPRLASLHFADCHPLITGYDGEVLRDSDGDGIPNDYKVDYGTACVAEPEVGAIIRVTISGYRRLQDSGHGFRSFRVTVKDLVIFVEYLDTGARHRTTLNAVEEGRFAPEGATYSLDLTITEFTSVVGDPDRNWFRRLDVDQGFAPDVGETIAFAAPLPAGSVTFGGLMQHVEPEVIGRIYYTFDLDTPTALHWSPACNGGDFTQGSFRGRYDGMSGVGFQYTWNGCSSLTRDLFGY